jgi:hypothetical protein
MTLCIHALRKHADLAKAFVELMNCMIVKKGQFVTLYRDELYSHSKTTADYINVINDIIPFLNLLSRQTVIQNGLVDYWIEMCSREAENEGINTAENRIPAVVLLVELWVTFTEYVDSKAIMLDAIIFMMKRSVRDRQRGLRMVALASFFKILDNFSKTRNGSAPLIYKTLIFSLVESPSELSIREMMLCNFIDLFKENAGIPIGLLIDPLFKLLINQPDAI